MGTSVDWEGNIGSVPEFKEFANGNKDPRRLLRLNVLLRQLDSESRWIRL